MDELVLSSYIRILQEGFSENNGQEAAAKLLLGAITQQAAANCSTDLSSKKISNIVKRKDPVPDDIKIASSKFDVIEDVYLYFSNEVMKELNPHLQYDVFEKVIRLVEKDDVISELKKNELKDLYDRKLYDKFLAAVFLYVLGRDNKCKLISTKKCKKRILYRSSVLTEDDGINLINDLCIKTFSKDECIESNEIYCLKGYFKFDSSFDDNGRRLIEAHTYKDDLSVSGDTSSENWISRSYMNNVTKTNRVLCTAWVKVLEIAGSKCRVQYLVIGDEV